MSFLNTSATAEFLAFSPPPATVRDRPTIVMILVAFGRAIAPGRATVTGSVVRHPKPPSRTWRRFLDNHVGCLVSIDFVVFIVPRHERRAPSSVPAARGHRRLG